MTTPQRKRDNRETYHAYKDLGVCTECHRRDAEPGRTRCPSCGGARMEGRRMCPRCYRARHERYMRRTAC
jgi:predicted amidophosphoribosyltransferase